MRLLKDRLKKIISYLLWQFQDPYYQGSAPQLAFFLFISIFPLVILLSQLLGIFSLSITDIEDWTNLNLSTETTTIIENFISSTPRGAGNLFLIILAIWGSSRAHFSLGRITNYTFTDGELTGRGWFWDRIRAIIAFLIVIVSLVLGLVILVYAPTFVRLVLKDEIVYKILQSTWVLLRWPIVFSLYFFTISYIYYALPQKRVPYKDIIPGSIFTALAVLAVTSIYNVYVKHNVSTSLIYGSLGSIVVLLFWFWVLAWIFIIGISLNRIHWVLRRNNPIPINPKVSNKRVPFSIGKLRNWVMKNVKNNKDL